MSRAVIRKRKRQQQQQPQQQQQKQRIVKSGDQNKRIIPAPTSIKHIANVKSFSSQKSNKKVINLPNSRSSQLHKRSRRNDDDSSDSDDDEDDDDDGGYDNDITGRSDAITSFSSGFAFDDSGLPFTLFDSSIKQQQQQNNKEVTADDTGSDKESDEDSTMDCTLLSIQQILRLEDLVDISCLRRADLLLQKLIYPTDLTDFWAHHWERKPLYSKEPEETTAAASVTGRNKIFSLKSFMSVVSKQLICEGGDIQFYRNGFPFTTTTTAATAAVVGEKELTIDQILQQRQQQSTVRLHNPQQYNDALWQLLSTLEFAFNSHVSATVVLSPEPSQQQQQQQQHQTKRSAVITAPYLDCSRCCIVLQLQGSSRWRALPFHRVSNNAKRFAAGLPTAAAGVSRSEAEDTAVAAVAEELERLPLQSMHLTADAINNSSSSNSSRSEGNISATGADIDVVLRAGDVLYIPKEFVYQQQQLEDTSLHLQIYIGGTDINALTPDNNNSSSNNNNNNNNSGGQLLQDNCCLRSLLQLALPQALLDATQQHRCYRRTLPRGLQNALGVAAFDSDEHEAAALISNNNNNNNNNRSSHRNINNSSSSNSHRSTMRQYISSVFSTSLLHAVLDVLDPAADQLQKQFIAQRLPVPLSLSEEQRSAAAAPTAAVFPYTLLRVLRPGIAVAVVEDGKVVVYHCMDNARVLFGAALNPLEFELDDGPAIEALLNSYPDGVTVSDLNHPSEELEEKVAIAQALYKEGILIIEDEASNPAAGVIGARGSSAAAAAVRARAAATSTAATTATAATAVAAKGETGSGKKLNKKKQQLLAASVDDDDPF